MRSRLVALVAAAILTVAAPAATAETWHGADVRHDVTTFSYNEQPPPCGTSTVGVAPTDSRHDIRQLVVDHQADSVELRLTLGELKAGDSSTSYAFHVLVPRGAFYVDLFRSGPGKPLQTILGKEPDFDSATVDECGGSYVVSVGAPCEGVTARASAARDRVVVVLPRSCLKDPRWVKAGATVGGSTGIDSSGTSTYYSDEWAVGGETSSGYLPPYGPRVRRGGR